MHRKTCLHIDMFYSLFYFSAQAAGWEIVFGGWNNGQSVIRTSQQGTNLVAFQGAVLSQGQKQPFWIDWSTANLRTCLTYAYS